MPEHYKVLFLCTGNSARSIMAEAIMKRKGLRISPHIVPEAILRDSSAPKLSIRSKPLTSARGLRSKSWTDFKEPGAPPLDFVFTVCDNAAEEVCPFWPGQPMTAHWGVPDPAAVKGTQEEIDRAFKQAFAALDRKIHLLIVSAALKFGQASAPEGNRQDRTSIAISMAVRRTCQTLHSVPIQFNGLPFSVNCANNDFPGKNGLRKSSVGHGLRRVLPIRKTVLDKLFELSLLARQLFSLSNQDKAQPCNRICTFRASRGIDDGSAKILR